MKILFVSDGDVRNKGGIETYVRSLASEYLKNGFLFSDIEVSYLDSTMFSGFDLFNKRIAYRPSIKKKILEICPDVVHIHGFSSFFIFQVISVIPENVKSVYTPCYHPFSAHNRPLLAYLFFHLFSVRYIKKINKIILLTKTEKLFFKDYISEDRLTIIPGGITTIYDKVEPKVYNRTLLFIGRHDDNKRLDFLHSNKEFFFNNNVKVRVVTNVALNDNDVFEYYTGLTQSELLEVYKSCSIIMIPSKYESFSLVALEAMSAGLLVLMSSNVMIKDYIQNESFASVFEYGNQDSFKKRLIDMMDLEDAEFSNRSQLSRAFSTKFQWYKIAEDVFKIYRSS
jgi:glycosyltransferase involved in cell wall biosynthesis